MRRLATLLATCAVASLATAEELARYQASEITKWAKVVKKSGAKAD